MVDKTLWAPCFWYLIHTITLTLPKDKYGNLEKKNEYHYFFKNLGTILPCPKCQEHFQKYYKKNKIKTQTDLFQWAIDCHNDVNEVSGKKEVKYGKRLMIF